jgi:fatty-acyl-CoA synthase
VVHDQQPRHGSNSAIKLRTGDLGRVNGPGYLELTGRSSELFKVGGELVAPAEVERLLTSLPGVSQAYGVGLPDERYGEVPRGVTFLGAEALSTTATGKVQKLRLAERAG